MSGRLVGTVRASVGAHSNTLYSCRRFSSSSSCMISISTSFLLECDSICLVDVFCRVLCTCTRGRGSAREGKSADEAKDDREVNETYHRRSVAAAITIIRRRPDSDDFIVQHKLIQLASPHYSCLWR